ncbi:hypothetical protein OAL60_00225 [bacterium]|nr:hypothetical protein [bacterium]
MTTFCFFELGNEPWANPLNGSYRIPFIFLKEALQNHYIVLPPDKVDKADIVFIYNHSKYSKIVAQKNPNAYIVLVKPHIELPFPVNPRYFRPSDLYNLLRNFLIYDILSFNSKETMSDDFLHCKCMLSDTKQLALRYSSMGKDSIYFPLIENFSFLPFSTTKTLPSTNTRNLFFHGSRDNFIASLPFIDSVLTSVSELDIKLHVITNRSSNLPTHIRNSNIQYYKYSFDTVEYLLGLCDLGLAPTSFLPHRGYLSSLVLPLVFPRVQKNMRYTSSKLSENAGRSFLFAQAAMPFLTTPSPEASHYFSSLTQTITCASSLEVQYLTKLLLTDSETYSSLSDELFNISRTLLDFDQITCEFVNHLIKKSNV